MKIQPEKFYGVYKLKPIKTYAALERVVKAKKSVLVWHGNQLHSEPASRTIHQPAAMLMNKLRSSMVYHYKKL